MRDGLVFIGCVAIGGMIGWFFPNICGMREPIKFSAFYYILKAVTASAGLAVGGGVGVFLWGR